MMEELIITKTNINNTKLFIMGDCDTRASATKMRRNLFFLLSILLLVSSCMADQLQDGNAQSEIASVTFSNYKYTISYTSSNKGTPQHTHDVIYDYYAEIDTHGENIIEAGFVTSYSVASCKYGGYSATSFQCEVINNAMHYYTTEHRVGIEIDSGGYSHAIRPYVIVESGTYEGVIGFAFDSGFTTYEDDNDS